MAGSLSHFVGRTVELGSIDDVLDALDAERSTTVAIVGEPGIGKTRLLHELARRADERRHLVLEGTASELDRDVPFWVFVDALDNYIRGLDPAFFAPFDDAALAELAQVIPGLPGVVAAPAQAGTHERYRIHRAVALLLERLAASRPLVLVLDDLHWADSGSFELVMSLLRRPPAAPVLIALAMRPRPVPQQVSVALERALHGDALTRIDLGALSLAESEELLEAKGARAKTSALYAESGGNPFYLEQLARSLEREPRATAESGDLLEGVDVPAAVAAALAEELNALSADARRFLEGAAVAGEPFDLELAAATAGASDETALAALDDLLQQDLVRTTDVPRRFRFRHPLVRRAVYAGAPGGWRLKAHERAARALAGRGAPAAARARHVELSAREGDEAAATVLREAGEAAALRAPATAARWFDAALRVLSPASAPEDRVELLLARANALSATGHFEEGHEALLESLRLAPPDAVELRVRLVVRCAAIENQLGRVAQARARLERALEEISPDSPEAASLMIELAISALFQGNFDEMARWADGAIATAEPLNDRALTATALAVEATGAAMAASPRSAKRDEAARLVDGLSDDELAGALGGPAYLALAEVYLDRFEDARRHAARALAVSRATGQGELLAPINSMLGSALWIQGRLAEAQDVLSGAVEAARLVDNAQALCWTLFNYAYPLAYAGDLERALQIATEAYEIALELDPGPITGHAGSALALALSESGEPARAAEVLVSATGGDELRMIGGAWRGRNLELLTRCYLAAGEHALAENAADAARACADEVDLPMAHAMASLARSAIDLESHRASDAIRHALNAVNALEAVGAALDATCARVLAGRALALTDQRETAATELRHAATTFATFGAARYQARAEQELRKLGHRVYRRSTAGTASDGIAALTKRELELAHLVVDRKTNSQIATELFLSQKTVETHLRNIFRKVGVASRVELARAVEHAEQAARADH